MNPSIHTAQVLSARAVLFLGIAAFHVLLIYAFASGLLRTTVDLLVPDTPIKLLDREPARPTVEEPPHPAPVTLTTAVVPVPNELNPINLDVDPGTITLPSEPPGAALVGTPEPPALPIHLVGSNVLPNSGDYYPPSEIRQNKEGTAEVRSCVNANGRLDGTPTIEASSGRAPLDSAAIRLARDAKYARAMRGDTPVPNCYHFRVTFTLHGPMP